MKHMPANRRPDESLTIQWLVRKHMEAVLRIERESFPDPWDENDFVRVLKNLKVIGLVAMRDCEMLGFIIYKAHEKSLTILNLAVDKAHRRQGVGRAMMDKLIAKLSPQRRTTLDLVVSEDNIEAMMFFRKCGVRVTRVNRGHFASDENNGDGYLLQYRLFREQRPFAIANRIARLLL